MNFIFVGGIDGFSRLPVMLKYRDTNNADTLLTCFLERTYGPPSRVRAGQGLENVKIADYMISRRGVNRGSAITGKSTHNQRIERFWKDVYQEVLAVYYQLFYFIEDEGILDPFNDLHIWLYSTMFFYTKSKKSLTYGIEPGHSTDCAQLVHHLSECGWQVNCKLLWV